MRHLVPLLLLLSGCATTKAGRPWPPCAEDAQEPKMIAGQAPRFAPGQQPRATGYAAARCTITVEGETRDCALLYAPPGFGEPFMEALRTVRYAPPTRCGRSEERTTVVRFHYEAPQQPAAPADEAAAAASSRMEPPAAAQPGDLSPPVKVAGDEIVYTEEMRYHRVQGTVVARCLITLSGTLENCYILQPLPYADEAIVNALRTWRMRPLLFQGKPVASLYTLRFRVRPQ